MKNVLLLLHDDEGQESRLQAALDLTRALSGHLTCLDVAGSPQFVTDYFTGTGDATVLAYVREREAANCRAVEERLRGEDVPWTMLDTIGDPGVELNKAADLADIIVVSGPEGDGDLEARHLVGEVAVKSGHAVLVVPPSCSRFDATGKALVAWNGSHEASEALRHAIPLLQQASSVTLLELNRPSSEHSTEDAAAYLSRHGIFPRIVEEHTAGRVSDAIVADARAIGAAYIVLGAFGVPRWIEGVLGGVTANVLVESGIPILLAH